jgi:hypothetical protein
MTTKWTSRGPVVTPDRNLTTHYGSVRRTVAALVGFVVVVLLLLGIIFVAGGGAGV